MLGTGAAAAAWFLPPSAKYTTSSLLLVDATTTSLLDVGTTRATGISITSQQNFQKTQEQILRSRLVLSKALANPPGGQVPDGAKRRRPTR